MIELRFKKVTFDTDKPYELIGFKMLKASKLPSEYLDGTPRMVKQDCSTIIFAGDSIELEEFALRSASYSNDNWWICKGQFFTSQQVEAILAFAEKAGKRLQCINRQKQRNFNNGVEKFYI